MPIIYSLIARNSCVLAEFTTTSGNFTTIVRRLLEKIPSDAERMSYVYDRHVFHYIVRQGLVFLCMSDEQFGTRVPFAFLEDVSARWFGAFGQRGAVALAYGMNADFSVVLNRQMDQHSMDQQNETDSISRVRSEIDDVKNVMVQNIERVLERGERIELLVDKTESLNEQAFKFKRQSTHLKRALWWKNCKLWLMIAAVLLAILLVVLLSSCGLRLQKCVRHASPRTVLPP